MNRKHLSGHPRTTAGCYQSLKLVGLLMAILWSGQTLAVCLAEAPLRGVNLSGAEFNSKELPGTMYQDYTYPAPEDFQYFSERGANVVRLPIRWERVQHQLFGELDAGEMGAIRKTISRARENDLCVILDVHNYASYNGQVIGEGEVAAGAFIDLWKRLAGALDDPDYVALGLMNEPFRMDIADWAVVAQQTVTALRESGAEHLITVSGGRWAGVHEWFKTRTGSSNAVEFADFDDPLDRTVLEVHQYLNEGYSGTTEDCLPPEHFDSMFGEISNWARQNDQRLFLGEFGAPGREECLASLERVLKLVNDPVTWRGWAYWAAGAWWGDYFLSVHPQDGIDRPQMALLERYFNNWECADVHAGRCPEPPENLAVE